MKTLIQKNKYALNQKFGDKLWFRVTRFCVLGIIFLVCLVLQIVFGVLSVFSGDISDDNQNKRTSNDDRNADDIWKLTSGNDYYNKEPPDRFS